MSERRSNREERRSRFRDSVRANSQQQKEQRGSYGYLKLPSGVRTYSPKPGGKAFLDFMPYTVTSERHPDRNDEWKVAVPGSLWYRLPFKTHRNIGADNDSVVCLASIGRKCPVCEYRGQRMKEGAPRDETDALKQSQRNLYVVTPLDDREHEETPHIWDVSQFLFQNLLNDEIEEDERYADFPDPEVGYTLKIRFDEKSFAGNKFAEASRIDFVARERPYSEKDLKKVPNLDEVLNILPYKELEKLFLGLDDEDVADGAERKPVGGRKPKDDDDDGDDDRKPARRSSRTDDDDDSDRKPARRAARDEDEDDDRPARRRASTRDDDDKDDDAEDDDKGSRRRRSRDEDEDDDKDPPFDKDDDDTKEEKKEERKETRMSRRAKPSDDDDDGDKDEKPTRTRRSEPEEKEEKRERPAKAAKGGSKEDECPSGHKFGVDTDEHDDCDNCPLWEKCLDKKESKK